MIRPAHAGAFDVLRGDDDLVLGRVPGAVLQYALSQGLVQQNGELLEATPQARTFLRRALAEADTERFSAQHGELTDAVLVENKGEISEQSRIVRRNLDDSPLSSMARLRDKAGAAYFPAEAIDAGERLASDFERGHLQPRITASWEPRLAQQQKGQRSSASDLSDSALAARGRVTKAVMALGPELSGVLLDVCCFAKGLELVERERQWPARSAKLMLRTALMALARHYNPVKASSPAGLRHWGEAGYRPDMARLVG
ncbi:hypothetical protein BJF95_09860 [Rhizobium oryziradicis]|uniref:DUF6456 domain-containing protein n=1 Tax=Rhizobium oryziradicis TaxID=1867956 RepID=A0A1Q8ZUW2_9HYPH|nr:hypothetical protein BJF95_09860 [Rhizobium oryziradicis]